MSFLKKKYPIGFHLKELKQSLIKVVVFFILSSLLSYFFKENLLTFLVKPLLAQRETVKIIYTGLTEAFITYLKISIYTGIFLTFPFALFQLYRFISPALLENERIIVNLLFFISPILFFLGIYFFINFVMPKAWVFFLSFEKTSSYISLVLEAKINEYIALVLQLVLAFGIAFQLPILLITFHKLRLINTELLKAKRKFLIVIIFILAGFLTPPDIFSQFALAIPLILLYEISILFCKLIEKRGCSDDRYKDN